MLNTGQHRLAVAVEALEGNLVLRDLFVDQQDAQENVLHLLSDAVERDLQLLTLYLGIGTDEPPFTGGRASVPNRLAQLTHQRVLVVGKVEFELGYLEGHLDHLRLVLGFATDGELRQPALAGSREVILLGFANESEFLDLRIVVAGFFHTFGQGHLCGNRACDACPYDKKTPFFHLYISL